MPETYEQIERERNQLRAEVARLRAAMKVNGSAPKRAHTPRERRRSRLMLARCGREIGGASGMTQTATSHSATRLRMLPCRHR